MNVFHKKRVYMELILKQKSDFFSQKTYKVLSPYWCRLRFLGLYFYSTLSLNELISLATVEAAIEVLVHNVICFLDDRKPRYFPISKE